MTTSLRRVGCMRRVPGTVGLVLWCLLGFGSTGVAQTSQGLPSAPGIRDATNQPLYGGVLEAAVRSATWREFPVERLPPVVVTSPAQTSRGLPRPRRRPTGRRAVGIVVGAVGGFLAGGRLGAAIEGDSCRCDDPGFQGFLIGAPIGAVVGAVVGSLVAGR